MYCIFHLPRTGSHYLHSLINSSLSFLDPRHIGTELEPFNPAYNTIEQIHEKFNRFVNNDPPTTVKMSINHYPWLADEFIKHEKYTTIIIKPANYQRRLLKALVEKYFKTYSNGTDRKSIREPFVGTLKFSDELIVERLEHYKLHMSYIPLCDYSVYDEYVFSNSSQLLSMLGLPFVTPRYKRVAPFYSDEEMLENVDEFNEQYYRLSIQVLGYAP